MHVNWSEFEKLDGLKFSPADFRETLDGGQSFTWYESADSSASEPSYEGVFGKNAARFKLDKDGNVQYARPSNLPSAKKAAEEYLDAKRNYAKIRNALARTGDASMLRALRIYPTLRILRQSPQDAIISFICSSSKRIVQIKQCVRLLSENFGEEICGGLFSLPSFERLADADAAKIRGCKLGFRAEYLSKSAKKICADKFEPLSLREIPYSEAKKYLVSLSGVGEKVADCILLFGASRMEAFPVDTWIKQAMTELYRTPDNADKIRAFAAEKFGVHAGFAQQLIFAAKRKNLL